MQTRLLGNYEKLSYYINRVSAHNVVVSGKLQSDKIIDESLFISAYYKLLNIYPSFNICINELNNAISFSQSTPAESICFITRSNFKNHDLIAEVELEMNTPISTLTAPLVRIKIIKVTDNEYFIFISYHHTLAGAVPGFYLFNNFVLTLDRILNDKPLEIAPHPARSPIDLFIKNSAFRVKYISEERSRHAQSTSNIPVKLLRTRFMRKCFTKEQTGSILNKLRIHSASLNCAFISASLLALRDHSLKSLPCGIQSATAVSLVNLRKSLSSDITNDEMVYFSASFFNEYTFISDESIWEFSNKVKKQTYKSLKNREYFHEYRLINDLLSSNKKTPEQLLEIISPSKPSVCISTLGTHAAPDTCTSLRVKECFTSVSTHSYSRNNLRFLVVPQIYNEKLTVLMEYGSPALKHTDAKTILDRIIYYINS